MATAKKAAPAAKKSTSTALANWDEALAKKASAAKKVAASIGGGSRNVLSFKGGRLSYQGGNVPGNKLNVVVLSAINENNYFEGAYDPNNPASPVCYAFGSPDGEDEQMGPHEAVVKAGKAQSESGLCSDCPHNEWGSAETGRGKACKNVVSLAMITEDALESDEAIAKAEVFYAKLPVTSGKSWKGYVNDLGDKHFIQFVTQLEVEPQGETFVVLFEAQQEVDKKRIGALLEKSDKEDGKWGDPYPVFEAPPPKGRRSIPIKKAAGKPASKPPAKPARKY